MVAGFMKFVLLSLISIGLAAQPGDPAVLSEQARAAMASGRFDEAATVYRKLIAQMPNVGGLWMNLGLALFQARQYRAAATELKTALRLEPGLLPASMMLGICHGKLGEPLLAIPLLEKATKTMPENPVVVLELADAYYAVGRHPEAIRQFELLAGMQPKNPVAWRGLGVALGRRMGIWRSCTRRRAMRTGRRRSGRWPGLGRACLPISWPRASRRCGRLGGWRS